MNKKFLALSFLITITLLSAVFHPVLAQSPTFGPTCTPSPPLAGGPTPTPVIPVTAGSPALTSLALVLGAVFLLGSLGVSLLFSVTKTD